MRIGGAARRSAEHTGVIKAIRRCFSTTSLLLTDGDSGPTRRMRGFCSTTTTTTGYHHHQSSTGVVRHGSSGCQKHCNLQQQHIISTPTLTTTVVLLAYTQRRCKVYKFTVDPDNPERALRMVEEDLKRLRVNEQDQETQYMYKLVNRAICLFHLGDYINARIQAVEAHDKINELRGHRHTLVYFSAKTCYQACRALRLTVEAHMREVDQKKQVYDSLSPTQSKLMCNGRFLDKLKMEEESYSAIAERLFWAPDKSYMKSGADWDRRRGKGGGGAWDDGEASAAGHSSGKSDPFGEKRRARREFHELHRKERERSEFRSHK